MKNVPINRWTVGIVMVLTLIFGNDIVAPIMKVINVMTAAHAPAF